MPLDFSSRTNAWEPYLAPLDDGAHGGMQFLKAWLQKESDGNPCSFTKYHEAGIWQLMPGSMTSEGGGDMAIAGTTVSEQHPTPPCTPGSQNSASVDDLSQDQIDAQIRAGTNYINHAIDVVRTALQGVGSPIDESSADFWRFVKLVHAAPAWVKYRIADVSNAIGHPVASWDEFEEYATSVGCWGSGHCTDSLANARAVGAYGGNDPSPSFADQIEVLSGPTRPLSGGEIALVALAGLAGVVGAIYFQRWLTGGEGV